MEVNLTMAQPTTDRMFLLHCSDIAHPEGRVLTSCSRRDCENQGYDCYNQPDNQILEMFRPPELIVRKNAIYMVDNDEDIDLCGGYTDHVFIVRPEQPVSRHDLNWISEICCLLDSVSIPSCKEDADPRLVHAARSYWAGLPHPNESVREYLAPSAEVICEIPEGEDVDQVLSGYNEKSDIDFPDVPDW